jgi:hypothetical protein
MTSTETDSHGAEPQVYTSVRAMRSFAGNRMLLPTTSVALRLNDLAFSSFGGIRPWQLSA